VIKLLIPVQSYADLGVEVGGARSSTEGASRVETPKAPRGVKCGEEVSPSPQGERSGKVAVPPLKKLRLCDHNGVFSWTLGAKFRSFLWLKQYKNAPEIRTAMKINSRAIKNVTQGCLSL